MDPWIRRFHPAPDAAARVVCLPHAGGAATFYHPLSLALSPTVDVLTVQYPGRQDRRGEPCVADFAELVAELTRRLRPWADRPLAIFGHSLGSLLAFEVARRLGDAVVGIFASGHRPPALHRIGRFVFTDEELVADLRRLSGTGAALFDDDEAVAMVLPGLRGDYRASASYRHTPGDTVGCPILALTGDSDPEVSVDEAARWADHTTGEFDLRVYPGDHFFVAAHTAAIAGRVTDHVARWSSVSA